MATPEIKERDGIRYVEIPLQEVSNYSQFMLTGIETLQDVLGTLHNYITRFRRNFVPGAQDGPLDGQPIVPPLQSVQTPQPTAAPGTSAEPPAEGEKKRRRKREKKAKDPNAPKRPLTAYFLYLQHARPEIRQNLGGQATAGQISEEATRQWNGLRDDQKAPWRNSYTESWAEFNRKMKEYKAKTSESPDAVENSGVGPEEEVDGDEYEDAPTTQQPAAAAASDSEEEDEDEDEDEQPSPAPPPPPPKKAASPKGQRKQAPAKSAAPAVQPPAVATPDSQLRPTPAAGAEKKRKKDAATKDTSSEEPKKKKAKKLDVDGVKSSQTGAPSDTPAGGDKKEKKKGRKSKVAVAES